MVYHSDSESNPYLFPVVQLFQKVKCPCFSSIIWELPSYLFRSFSSFITECSISSNLYYIHTKWVEYSRQTIVLLLLLLLFLYSEFQYRILYNICIIIIIICTSFYSSSSWSGISLFKRQLINRSKNTLYVFIVFFRLNNVVKLSKLKLLRLEIIYLRILNNTIYILYITATVVGYCV